MAVSVKFSEIVKHPILLNFRESSLFIYLIPCLVIQSLMNPLMIEEVHKLLQSSFQLIIVLIIPQEHPFIFQFSLGQSHV